MFRTGNIVQLKGGNMVIITGERTIGNAEYKVMDWVSFEYENHSGSTPFVTTYLAKRMCWECDINDGGETDMSCECKGTGWVSSEVPGMDQAKYLAPNAKTYITDRLLRDWFDASTQKDV